MKKRALYYCRRNRDDAADVGIIRKCRGQAEALRQLGYEVDLLWLCRDGILLNDTLVVRTWLKIRPHTLIAYGFYFLFFHWLILKKLDLRGYALFYGRYELSHPMLLYFLKSFRRLNNTATIIIEIPTYPYESEMQGGMRRLQYWLDRQWRKKLRRYVNYIATPAFFEEIFGIPVLHLPNGIETKGIPRIQSRGNGGALTLAGVGNWQWWHGLDRLVDGLARYYQKPDVTPKIKVRLAGSVAHVPWLPGRIAAAGLEQHFSLHPPLQGDALNSFFEGADLGVGVLGGSQKGLPCAFPLKHREYACRGLPFIYSLPDPGMASLEECLILLPDDGNPVDFGEVLKKWKKLKGNCQERLRAHALKNFDWSVVMQRMLAKVAEKAGKK